MKEKGMTIDQVVNAVDIAIHKLPFMETLYGQAKDQAEKMQCTIQRSANNIRTLEYKISLLDATAFSCEQDCRRKEQQLQELTAQKDRLEKWIANVSNNDELKQMVKENVKVALSENKQIVSVAFTTLLQTLKSDPQMINIIYKILAMNNGEQHKNNNNNDNTIKYLESNKDNLLELAEKHYQNLVEVLTNNVIDFAAASSTPTLSSPQPSSIFSSPLIQSDAYKIEESESFHDSKSDIAD